MKNIVNTLSKFLDNDNNKYLFVLKNWESIVGNLKEKMRLEVVQDDLLIIGVYESHWMQELFLLSRHIQKKINDSLGDMRVKGIRFKLVEKKQIKKRPENISKQVAFKKVDLSEHQKQGLKKIKDENLRTSLLSYLYRCSNNPSF